MSAMPNPYDDHAHAHEHSESDSKPLLDRSDGPGPSTEAVNPVYEPDYRFSYTDEHFNYYPSGPSQSQAKLDGPFTSKPQDYSQQTRYENLDYAEPFAVPAAKSSSMMSKRPNMFQRYFGMYPLAQRIEDKKRGIGVQRHPIACLNNTANPATLLCTLEDICGFGGFHGEAPNQWFRFITPIFLHAGVIHFLLNMLAQLTASAQVEREMGTISFLVLYAAAGIFGNVLGGNFSLVGVPSVGASGAIFGTVAVAWVDLFAHWRYQYQPGKKLVFMIIELIIGVAIGFIPYVDNFAHLGGLAMGLLVGMALYPIISPSNRHRTIVITLRVIAVPLAVVMFVVLIRNFYKADPYAACSWCRYLSCIPTAANNHCKGNGQ
ncbi:hypothetical protein BN946_scf185013.g122 [Trametes cinnabarina]|uniref:Rhomboid-type serine protease n=1 Tax=Pycnoporus cinnabarinus TaxID=5643 RepID=A0A060SG39_PYCCI|nr:hypothetical protein BN946_scf185013.g122 [Trametes cinnabarina]